MLTQIGTTLIGFFILVVFLKKFFWGAMLKMLDTRRSYIEGEIRQAAEMKQELAKLQADYQERLTKIEEEARDKIRQAVSEGKQVAAEIQEQARAQGEALLAKSKQAVELELAKARVELRDQIAGFTIEAAEKILRQKLDAQADRKLIDAVLDDLEKGAARA